MTRQRTKRRFLAETARYLAWITGVGIVIVFGMSLLHTGHQYPSPDEQPLPVATAPVTVPTVSGEDSAGWNCATQGNHICGPDSGHPAGCYNHGVLIVPWSNYATPQLDPLWAQFTAPC